MRKPQILATIPILKAQGGVRPIQYVNFKLSIAFNIIYIVSLKIAFSTETILF